MNGNIDIFTKKKRNKIITRIKSKQIKPIRIYPTVISLFAGCGGSSLGYKMAGFKELLAVDFNNNAIKTFKLNFPKIPVWKADITKITEREIMAFCKIKEGELDILDGSPPCQGFSIAGKRVIIDTRNRLFESYCKILKGLQPKVFVMENVSGVIKGKMKGMFVKIIDGLKKCGYNVKCKLMNTMYYGVPQSRERLIWIGTRKTLKIEPSFPTPNNDKLEIVKSALEGCPNGIYYNLDKKSVIYKYIIRIKQGQTGAFYHKKGNFFNLKRLNQNKPSYTLCKNASRSIIHYHKDRFITDSEAKRLSSFPDNFKLSGTALERIGLIGNSVMPKFMKAIAKHIKIKILKKIRLDNYE